MRIIDGIAKKIGTYLNPNRLVTLAIPLKTIPKNSALLFMIFVIYLIRVREELLPFPC